MAQDGLCVGFEFADGPPVVWSFGKLVKARGLRQAAGAMVNLLDTKFLFASLLWGSIGVGYFIYGKKQQAMPPLIGGLVMIALSYFVESWFWMSLAGAALMAAIYWLVRHGY